MISLMDDVQSKKPHLRYAGKVWSCTSYRMVGRVPVFRIGMGYEWRDAWEDWLKQEFT